MLFRQLTPQMTVLQHTGPALSDEQREQLDALDIKVIDGTVMQVESDSDDLTSVLLSDDYTVRLDALVVVPRFTARAEALAPLGLEPAEVYMDDHLLGTRIEADITGATASHQGMQCR